MKYDPYKEKRILTAWEMIAISILGMMGCLCAALLMGWGVLYCLDKMGLLSN